MSQTAISTSQTLPHRDLANAIRALAMDAVERAQSGHPGMPMGMADVATVLWTRFLKFDPTAPDWPDRDRFVLSPGHGSMLLYALLHLTGFPGMDRDALMRFRQLGALTPRHPEYGHTPGVETTTGPLGKDEVARARQKLGWSAEPFVMPRHILSAWRAAGARNRPRRCLWERALAQFRKTLCITRPTIATRKASENTLAERERPSVLVLSRQNLPTERHDDGGQNLSARGAYVLVEARAARQLTILASGSEVTIARAAQQHLEQSGIPTALVSIPCFARFDAQDAAYRAAVLGNAPRLAIEAASPYGWARYVGSEDHVPGMKSFGAAAVALGKTLLARRVPR